VTGFLARSLPLRVGIEPGEALDGWLLRLAQRNQIPAQWLLGALGLAELVRTKSCRVLVRGLTADQLRRVEQQTGLAPGALDTAVLHQYHPAGWPALPGSRFCVDCLREPETRWPIRWQLPYTFACLRHRSLLAGYCPACQQAPHNHWSIRTGTVDPHHCTLRHPTSRKICGTDLRDHRRHKLTPDDPRLAAQRWINTRLDAIDDPDTAGQLHDLHALAQWFRKRTAPTGFDDATVTAAAEDRSRRRSNTDRRKQALETVVTAAVTTQAVELLTITNSDELFTRFRPLISNTAPSDPRRLDVSHRNLATLTSALTTRLLAACDPHLHASDRLRYRTTTTPRLVDHQSGAVAANRARHLPEYLWPEWIIRLRPAAGSFTDTIATDIPAALMLPGNPNPNMTATTELTAWRNSSSRTLNQLADRYPDVLTALVALADYLDTHGSPIDYRRRRALFTDITMDRQQWEENCYSADAHPGQATRHLNARRYLFSLLTGANLANTRHPLAFPNAGDKHDYLLIFQRELTTPLREALHDYAHTILRWARIDEPLTWTPPGDLVTGLTLPGREPDDIDLVAIDHLINQQRLPATAAADKLGVTTEHIRYAISQMHRPGKTNGKNTPPASRRLRERAAALLTAEFFQREYLDAGKDLRTIEAETGIHRKLLANHAKALGIELTDVRTMNKPIPIDPDWLREQAEVHQRSSAEIAAELGLTPETVRRNLARFNIARRPQGFAGMPSHSRTYPDLPDDICRAVEGPRHGRLRLRRFQQIIAYPSLNVARRALGSNLATLTNQIAKLETDIGKPLLNRGRPYRPMTPTEHGQALLALLQQPRVAELLDQYAKPLRGWRPDDPRRSTTRRK
jgi:hypothetical protein